MGKNRIPKRIAGMKVPKSVRRSKLLSRLLQSPLGRDILAKAVTAGAGAAAAMLVRDREQVADAADSVSHGAASGAKATARGTGKAADLIGEALEAASDAVLEVIADAARSLGGKKGGGKKAKHRRLSDADADRVRH